MLEQDAIERVAHRLADAYVTRRAIAGHDALGDDAPTTVADGYAVQRRMRDVAGIEPAGWKVGATSDVAQQLLGVDGPFLGAVGANRVVGDGHRFDIAAWFTGPPAIEVEVGLRPGVDLVTVPDDPMDLAGSVEVVPCIEVVDSRFGAVVGTPGPCLIADNGVNAARVVGDPLDLDEAGVHGLDSVAVTLVVDGGSPVEGTGSMAMGHPLAALAAAARTAIGLGRPIAAGEVVSTGTCTGLTPVSAGTRVVGTVGGARLAVEFG